MKVLRHYLTHLFELFLEGPSLLGGLRALARVAAAGGGGRGRRLGGGHRGHERVRRERERHW